MPRKRAPQTRGRGGASSEVVVQTFIKHLFATNWNATRAYELMQDELGVEPAPQHGSPGKVRYRGTLWRRASEFLHSPAVQEALESYADAAVMGASEVLMRVSDQARANIDDCYDDEGSFSITKARERGVMHLIKSITTDESPIMEEGEIVGVRKRVRAELHDSQKALQLLMKYHHLLTEFRAAQDLPKDREGLTRFIMNEHARVTGKTPEEAQKLFAKIKES